jgi:hypothetical protein
VNIFIITIIGIVVFLTIFFVLFPPQNDGSFIPQVIIKPEHYDIEITGLKDTYLVGEPYSFSYILYGFGDPCGGIHITFPINKTDSSGTGWIPSCLKTIQTDFVLDVKKTYGTTYGHIALQESGNYTVKVTFEKGANGPTVATKSFLVVDVAPTDHDILDKKPFVADKYGKVTLDRKDALDICGAIRLPCPTNPTFSGKMLDENNVLVKISGTSNFDVKLNQTHVCVTSETETTCEMR